MKRYPAIPLNGAVVAITGGARGIGRATAAAFIARGARVSIGDIDLDLAKQTAAEIGATAHHVDVTDRASFATFLDEVGATHGELDVLVNNAGIMPVGSFLEMDERVNRAVFDVNVHGVITGMQLAAPGMVERGRGHVVNLASLFGKLTLPGFATYNASKFAVVGLSRATRMELDKTGVSVSAVLPSAVDTELASGLDFKPLPLTQPTVIADAVVRSVETRAAEIAVPGWIGGLATAAAMAPEPMVRGLRRILRADRGLTDVDRVARRAYDDRTSG
jgi:NAD(P)-dependent dehydrogenase (short-subunit alcohol dehydrogenase family)